MVHDELPKYLLVTLKQRTEKQPDGRKNASRAVDSPAGSALRLLVRQPAADDGGHTENPHGTA